MKKTSKTGKPAKKNPQPESKQQRQERKERAIRFSKLRSGALEEEENRDGKSNKSRKHQYYQDHIKGDKKRPAKRVSRTIRRPPEDHGLFKEGTIRLNKYLAHSGVAARRKADELISQGLVQVNGKVVTEMGYRLSEKDVVTYLGKAVVPVRHVYILLNKPKDTITSVKDERDRKTVMDIIANATSERVYPVGRLDRNTTGLLLLTNDGELAQELSHPSREIEKMYLAELDKGLDPAHLEEIRKGITLEDGPVNVDDIAYADKGNRKKVGVALHVGKNRIVRRIFEHFGYTVIKLDRTVYAGLTKKDLPRSKWRKLKPAEIRMLKGGSSAKGKKRS